MVLEDQVVFITGASRGFGFAATEELLAPRPSRRRDHA